MPYSGVVSLLSVLDFYAKKYLDIVYRFGLLLGKGQPADPDIFSDVWSDLLEEANRLDLPVTKELIGSLILELFETDPTKCTIQEGNRIQITGVQITQERSRHHAESAYQTLLAELGALLLKVIPSERKQYVDGSWLVKSNFSNFPTSLKELERAGECYAVGQPTAAVFHSMRALEPGLAALAVPFNVSAAQDNWQKIIEQLEAEIRSLGHQPKSQQKLEEEKFFGAAISHLYFVKNAWRNHVAHTRESYSDDEALKIIRHSQEFIESLCPKLKE